MTWVDSEVVVLGCCVVQTHSTCYRLCWNAPFLARERLHHLAVDGKHPSPELMFHIPPLSVLPENILMLLKFILPKCFLLLGLPSPFLVLRSELGLMHSRQVFLH